MDLESDLDIMIFALEIKTVNVRCVFEVEWYRMIREQCDQESSVRAFRYL